MLRYIYFVSLLLCISLSEEEFLRPGKRHFSGNRHERRNINRKREDSEFFDDKDKDSIAHIDVASFIQNPDISINREPRRLELSDYSDDSPITNAEFEKDRPQDYQSLESDFIPEVNVFNGKRVPHYLNIKSEPTEKINEHLYKTNEVNNVRDDILFNTKHRHNAHAEKKCILKNMKIPFFSRDKHSTTKTKKKKKRKLFGFRNSKKTTNVTKFTDVYNSNNIKKITKEPQRFKVNKRSYYERLCPACKQKFILHSNLDLMEKFRRTASNVIHNSRQYYQNKQYGEADRENIEEPNNFPVEHQNKNSDNENFNDYTGDRRKRNNEIKKTEISEMKDTNKN